MKRIDAIPKSFEPKQAEERIYQKWIAKRAFYAKVDQTKKPYTIVIPPPNITGQLHMGHALDNTIQDVLIRWRRMQGYSTLWLPGTDHASIATEAKIVEAMSQEGISKEEIGREEFLKRAWEWKRLYGGRIVEQLKRLGSSCDWERERFTMDEGLSKAVTEVFVRLYEKGLIYRGERMINWCPTCHTSISEAEVEYEERDGYMWFIRYPLQGDVGEVVVATTRPETMLGDTAVAVHPEDERFINIVGKKVLLPLVNRLIPVIADSYVDKEFGTGVVKITPAHDPNDFEIGHRHHLEILQVIDDNASMNDKAGIYSGLDRYEARKRIVEDLKAQGYLCSVQPHKHNIGHCYRCATTVEPKASLQWFVEMKPLSKPAIDAVKKGDITLIPERFSKIYFHWMENVKDWCISRQLWWGHRIPAYYCSECGDIVVSRRQPDRCPQCGCDEMNQDPDTLDTWFSSAIWPFSTLGWPNQTEDFNYFYPTSVLVTGYDIIFFWVARMIFSALEHTGTIPFRHVFVHGIIRDEQGKKMSKSLGNGIDPLDVIDQYGADALRYALINGISPGNDARFLPMKAEAGRNFSNKIWNAFRFVMMNFDDGINLDNIDLDLLHIEDQWILSRLNQTIREVTENLEGFEIGVALSKIHNFFWEDFCDWYIEMVKPRLFDLSAPGRIQALYTLNYVLCAALKLLHPYMPYLTEEIYQYMIHEDGMIMTSFWPQYNERMIFPKQIKQIEILMDAIRKIRNIRAEMNVVSIRKTTIIIVTSDSEIVKLFTSKKPYLERAALVSNIKTETDRTRIPQNSVTVLIDGGEIFIPLEDLIDIEKEIIRLREESLRLENEMSRLDTKLTNQEFISRAPEKIVEAEQVKRQKTLEMKKSVDDRIQWLTCG
jgi:valyl-tRNA synthetase